MIMKINKWAWRARISSTLPFGVYRKRNERYHHKNTFAETTTQNRITTNEDLDAIEAKGGIDQRMFIMKKMKLKTDTPIKKGEEGSAYAHDIRLFQEVLFNFWARTHDQKAYDDLMKAAKRTQSLSAPSKTSM